jgi:glucose dehydrogenase
MSEFKSQRECWEALLAGKTLVNLNGNKRKLSEFVTCELGFHYPTNFEHFMEWSTYVEPKKKVMIAPSLNKDDLGRYFITSTMHSSAEQAKHFSGKSFIKWMIETPYAIEVEE